MDKELLYRFIEGNLTEAEERTVTEWLQSDPTHQETLNALWFVHDAAIVNAPSSRHVRPLMPPKPSYRPQLLLRRCIRVAAAVLLMVGACYTTRNIVIEQHARQYLAIAAPAGQRVDITLQDGTTVCLNSGAKLEYPVRFGKTRRVKLSGEAMFDVEHSASRPFVVETFACDVEVLGTKFNVTADERTRDFSTALLRGRLRVNNKLSHDDAIEMKADDFVSLKGDRLTLHRIENANDYLWPEGILNLAGHDFREIVKRLEQLYGVEITVEKSELPRLNLIRGKISIAMGLDYALRALQKIAPFDYEQVEYDRIVIK